VVAAEDSHVQEIVVDDGDNMRLEDDTQTDIMVEGDIGTGYTLPTGVGEVAAHVSLREAVGGAHLEVLLPTSTPLRAFLDQRIFIEKHRNLIPIGFGVVAPF
jgi:hypothetical protein